MATLTDLQAKRTELNTAVQAYRQAVLDFNTGSITQTQLDTFKSDAQVKGDEYAKLAAQVKNDDPAVTDDADLYSNPTVMSLAKREAVAKIMRTGTYLSPVYDDFSSGLLAVDQWEPSVEGTRQSVEIVDGDLGKVLQLKAATFPGYESARVVNKTLWSPGTSFKVRARMDGRNGVNSFLGLRRTDENGAVLNSVDYEYNRRTGYTRIGLGTDVDGNPATGGVQQNTGTSISQTSFSEYELRWVDASTLEWYKDGVLQAIVTGNFSEPHEFLVNLSADKYSQIVYPTLEFDWIDIGPLP